MTSVAINTDVGEGYSVYEFGDDAALLDHVTAANIACGFHAGDPDILRRTCGLAVERGVSIGAQVSYRDRDGFGRRFIDVPHDSLVNDLLYQLGALDAFVRVAGGAIGYVKAHGALYNSAAHHLPHATAIVDATRLFNPALPVVCQASTATWRTAVAAGTTVLVEAFADRSYTTAGLLVPRSEPDAVITDAEYAAQRGVDMVMTGEVPSITGDVVAIAPPSHPVAALCVHSDTPGAAAIAMRLRQRLTEAGVVITSLPPKGQGQ